MKKLNPKSLKTLALSLCLAGAGLAPRAEAAFYYWDPQGSWGSYSTYTAGSLAGNWEDASWSTNDQGQLTPMVIPEKNPAAFGVGTGSSNSTANGTVAFTVTLQQNHTVAGIFNGNGNPNSAKVTFQGPGIIYLAGGEQGVAVYSSSDHSVAWLIFNTPISELAGQPATLTAEGYDWSGVGAGSPQIFLNVANSYSGGTELGYPGTRFGGILNFALPEALGTGPIKVLYASSCALAYTGGTGAVTVTNAWVNSQNGGSVNLVGTPAGLTFSGNWSLGGNSITLGSGGTGNKVILAGIISGSGGLTKGMNNAGVLALTGANIYTGGTTNTQGILTVNALGDTAPSAIGTSASSVLAFSGGTFQYTGAAAAATARPVWLTANSTLDLPTGAGTLSLNGQFRSSAGTYAISKTGPGTLILGGSTDNISLGLTVNGGTVVLNKASTSGVHAVGSTTTVNNGGTLQLSGTGGDQIWSGVNVTVNNGGVFDANGMNEGMNSLTLYGTGQANGGALINSAAATTSFLTNTAASGFPLGGDAAIGGAGNLTLLGVVSGAHVLTKVGSGILNLNSANTYSGGTLINAGTVEVSGSIQGNVTNVAGVLQLDNAAALASGAVLVLPSAPADGSVNLNFAAGTYVSVSSLYFGSSPQAVGTWGGSGSGAQHISTVFSGSGMLNISGAPIVLQVPQSMFTYVNGAASLSVNAVGSVPMTFQWSRNGMPITGASLPIYSLSHAQLSDAGTYTCFIQNSVGSTNTPSSPSPAAVLTVLDASTTDGYANEILNNVSDGTPIAYYRLDEATGTTVAHDIVGGYNGVYNNVALGQAGFSPISADTAAGFGPGANSYVGSIQGISFEAPTSTTAFTLEAWVKGPSSQTGGAGIITKGTGNGGEQFNLDVYGGVYRFFLRDSAGNIPNGAISATVGPNGTWQHVVAVYDGPNGYYALYVNGIQAGQKTASTAGILSSTHEITIGSRQSGSNAYDSNFNGSIDEVAIYAVALSGGQVYNHYLAQLSWPGFAPRVAQQPQSPAPTYPGPKTATFSIVAGGDLNSLTYQWLFNGTPIAGANWTSFTLNSIQPSDAGTYTCALTNSYGWTNSQDAVLTVISTNGYMSAVLSDNPISYWRLDETSGTLAHDYWGGNNGTYNNVVLNQPGYSVADADPGIGLPANTANRGFVSVTNYSPFTFVGAPPFTFEGWVNFSNVTGVQRLFSTMRVNVSPYGYGFGISGANQLVFTTAGVLDTYANLKNPLVPGAWYYLVCTCDGNAYNFYVDGKSVGSQPITSNTGAGVPLTLGNNPSTWTYSEQVNGRLDELAVYNTALTADRVQAHYNARPHPTIPVPSTPIITTGGTNYVGLTATFQENASGLNLSYQWYKAPGTAIPNATDSTMTLPPLSLSDAGSYYVQVYNESGSTNSDSVVLTVWPVPTLASQLNLTNGLVLHLPLDGDYKDISGHGHNGTAVGAPTFASPGAIGGNALSYSSTIGGPYNYVSLGVVRELQFSTNIDFTVSYWVQLPAGSTFTNLPFFTVANGSTFHGGFAFAPCVAGTPLAGTGGWGWSIGTVDEPGQYSTANYNTINDGNWHHLVHVAQRSANCTTYLDGVQVDSTPIVEAGSVTTTNAATIGQDPTGTYPATASAYIDDLAVWTNTLTPLQVSGIYLAGSKNTPGVSFAPPVVIVAPVTITGMSGTTLSYTGGSGSTFILLSSPDPKAPLSSWTVVGSQSATPGTFPIPLVGSSSTMFYCIKSQ